MAGLSSFLWGDDGEDAWAFRRPASEADRHEGVRRLLGDPDAGHFAEFFTYAAARRIDLNGMWLAVRKDKTVTAALPVHGAGRVTLLMIPEQTRPGHEAALTGVVRAATADALSVSRLCQVLLDPADRPGLRACLAAGYTTLATLVYLQRTPRRPAAPAPPAGLSLLNYGPATHSRFAAAITASYTDSLDCPALARQRDIEDVIASHQSAGVFDPNLWFLVARGEENLGVLLLSTHPGVGVELVYLGLAPAARGQRLGDWLMRFAASIPATIGADRITLAVDSDNTPALHLYFRHGFGELHRRVALVKSTA